MENSIQLDGKSRMCLTRIIINIIAIVKGALFKGFTAIFRRKDVNIGKNVRICNRCSLRFDYGASIKIGNSVKIDRNSTLYVATDAKLMVQDKTGIGAGNMIICRYKISIGKGTTIAPNVLIYDHDHVFDCENGVKYSKYDCSEVNIGDNCWIGANTVILRGTFLGDNSVVAAGSVIKGNYPPGSLLLQKRETELRRK